MLAQSYAIHGSNKLLFFFFHFENKNLPDVSLKKFCFEFLTIPRVLIFF